MENELSGEINRRPLFKNIDSICIAETDAYIALNKPSGLLSIPDRTQSEPSLKDHLQDKYGHIFTVHRLDRETSGLILFAKTEAAHQHFSRQFEERSTDKIYNGLVLGRPALPEAVIDEPIKEHFSGDGRMMVHAQGKPAVTQYRLLEQFRLFAWMEFRILTGRTHQIRVHMKHAGHSIACDPLYGDGQPVLLSTFKKKFNLSKQDEEEKPLMGRLALHAASLGITDQNGERLQLEAPLPKDLKAMLQQLRKWSAI